MWKCVKDRWRGPVLDCSSDEIMKCFSWWRLCLMPRRTLTPKSADRNPEWRCAKSPWSSARSPESHLVFSRFKMGDTLLKGYLQIKCANPGRIVRKVCHHFALQRRVAELGSLSSRAKMAMKIFVKRVFTIFASNASFLRVIANLQN